MRRRFRLFHYIKRFGYNNLPSFYFRAKYKRLKKYEQNYDQEELQRRLNYYVKIEEPFSLPEEAVAIKNFKKTKGTEYYLDLKDYTHYFTVDTQFSYKFGDDTTVYPYPSLIKARPIDGNNQNSILFKLNKKRHFKWVNDPYSFAEKKDLLIWRGGAYKDLRKTFVKEYYDHPLCNVGQTNKPPEDVPWQKDFAPIKEHLEYKFIFCPEGNDVSTNLKWVMSSNSLAFMPKPKFETWFMEGTLKAGVHYVEIKEDFSDLEEKIAYYSKHTKEAESIIKNAHAHVKQFRNKQLEELLCLKVLERFTELSQQEQASKYLK